MASEGDAGGSFDGTSYTEDYSGNVSDSYQVEGPPWIDSVGSHWHQAGYAVEC